MELQVLKAPRNYYGCQKVLDEVPITTVNGLKARIFELEFDLEAFQVEFDLGGPQRDAAILKIKAIRMALVVLSKTLKRHQQRSSDVAIAKMDRSLARENKILKRQSALRRGQQDIVDSFTSVMAEMNRRLVKIERRLPGGEVTAGYQTLPVSPSASSPAPQWVGRGGGSTRPVSRRPPPLDRS